MQRAHASGSCSNAESCCTHGGHASESFCQWRFHRSSHLCTGGGSASIRQPAPAPGYRRTGAALDLRWCAVSHYLNCQPDFRHFEIANSV